MWRSTNSATSRSVRVSLEVSLKVSLSSLTGIRIGNDAREGFDSELRQSISTRWAWKIDERYTFSALLACRASLTFPVSPHPPGSCHGCSRPKPRSNPHRHEESTGLYFVVTLSFPLWVAVRDGREQGGLIAHGIGVASKVVVTVLRNDEAPGCYQMESFGSPANGRGRGLR